MLLITKGSICRCRTGWILEVVVGKKGPACKARPIIVSAIAAWRVLRIGPADRVIIALEECLSRRYSGA